MEFRKTGPEGPDVINKSCRRYFFCCFVFFFLNQINVKGNDILITATLICQRVFSQCLPTTRLVENQPGAEIEAVWEAGTECKVRFL